MKSNLGGRLILILVGLALVFLGIRGPLLKIAGKSALATITEIKQDVNATSNKMDYNFTINYEFQTGDGSLHQGSFSKNKVYNQASLPNAGNQIEIRYIAALPFINAPAQKNLINLPNIAMVILGLFIILVSGKLNSRRKESVRPAGN